MKLTGAYHSKKIWNDKSLFYFTDRVELVMSGVMTSKDLYQNWSHLLKYQAYNTNKRNMQYTNSAVKNKFSTFFILKRTQQYSDPSQIEDIDYIPSLRSAISHNC